MTTARKVLTVGGAMVDTIAIVGSDRIERMAMHNADTAFLLLEEGRKTEALEISTHCGGGAVNSAVALARLGFDVATLVKLGRDARAEFILARLMAEGVSTRWAERTEAAPTGASVMISSHERNAAIFTFRGANTLLVEPELRDDAFAVDLVYVAGLSNESANCFVPAVDKAKAAGALVATNPGLRQLTTRSQAFFDQLGKIDILSVNRAEANALVPALVARFGEGGPGLAPVGGMETLPQLARRGFEGGGFELGFAAFFHGLLRLGVRHVLVTDGGQGAYAANGGEIRFCPPLEREVKGTAGAGDAFSATFSGFLALGAPLETALRAAAVNAGSVIGQIDTQSGLLPLAEIEAAVTREQAALPVTRWAIAGA